ncbi:MULTISPECIES: MarR family transcriptional regulator [Micrococcaceae]|uniref:MarR family winged helix-turn-helix transcriptional regulator n=1 Tax=Micrococcaceae TaxID=1268 RepID=UPI001036EA7F|nr:MULTISPECIES: MarR family transcriptional regulator [Micrococcaceae]TAP25050.1 MarR family transcriptional regulator [Arthrobacter sp. S41]UXN32032.1 helix-turn-helix domain-containing protein [Glutamicibacter sp. M10]
MGRKERETDIESVYHHMQMITRRANSRSRQLAEPLSTVEHSLLRFIADTPGSRATDIAEAFSLNRSTVSRQVGTLLDLGYAAYDDSEAGRGRILELTKLGQERLDASAAVHRAAVIERLEGWSAEQISDFAAALERYNEADSQ